MSKLTNINTHEFQIDGPGSRNVGNPPGNHKNQPNSYNPGNLGKNSINLISKDGMKMVKGTVYRDNDKRHSPLYHN